MLGLLELGLGVLLAVLAVLEHPAASSPAAKQIAKALVRLIVEAPCLM